MQAVLPQMSRDLDIPSWLLSLAFGFTLGALALGAWITPRLTRGREPRKCAFWSALGTAVPLSMMAALGTDWWTVWAIGILLGLLNQSNVFVEDRLLDGHDVFGEHRDTAKSHFSFATYIAFWAMGISLGKGLDSIFVTESDATWRLGFVAQAGAAVIIAFLFRWLVPWGGTTERREVPTRRRDLSRWLRAQYLYVRRRGLIAWLKAHLKAAREKMALNPTPEARRAARMLFLSQVLLLLLDTSLTSLLEKKGYGVDHLWILATTFVPGAIIGAFAIALMRDRKRGVLLMCSAIVLVWPIVGIAFLFEGDLFLWLLWFGEFDAEAVTTTLSGGILFLMFGMPARAAYKQRSRALGQMTGVVLALCAFLVEATFDVPLPAVIVAVGSIVGVFTLISINGVRRTCEKLHRVSRKGVLLGSSIGLGGASATGLQLFIPLFSVQIGDVRAYALMACGWLGLLVALGFSILLRARMFHWTVALGASFGGFVCTIVIAVASRPHLLEWAPIEVSPIGLIAVALAGVGVAAGIMQVVEIASRRHEVRTTGSSVVLNASIIMGETITNMVVAVYLSVLAAQTGTWELAYYGIAVLFLVQAAIVYKRRANVPPRERREPNRRDEPLGRFLLSQQVRLTALSMIGTSAPYSAVYVVMADLVMSRGGFGGWASWVIVLLSALRAFAGPVPMVAARFIKEGNQRVAKVAYGVAIVIGIELAIVAAGKGLVMAIGVGVGILGIEVAIAVGYVALRSDRDLQPNPGLVSTLSRAFRAVAGLLVATAAAGLLGLFDFLGRQFAVRVLGLGFEDLGRSSILLLGVSATALLAYVYGPRKPLKDAEFTTVGRGKLSLAALPMMADGRSIVITFSAAKRAEFERKVLHYHQDRKAGLPVGQEPTPNHLRVNAIGAGEKVLVRRSDGGLIAELIPTGRAVAVGRATRKLSLSDRGRWYVTVAGGFAWWLLLWRVKASRGSAQVDTRSEPTSDTLRVELKKAGCAQPPDEIQWIDVDLGDVSDPNTTWRVVPRVVDRRTVEQPPRHRDNSEGTLGRIRGEIRERHAARRRRRLKPSKPVSSPRHVTRHQRSRRGSWFAHRRAVTPRD